MSDDSCPKNALIQLKLKIDNSLSDIGSANSFTTRYSASVSSKSQTLFKSGNAL
jgi:hypothetical protein